MSSLPNVLPTNRDENWRYANLRPLAKAKIDAATGDASSPPVLPPALPDYERWVFVDGQFAAVLSQPATGSAARLLDAKDAGESFAALLDSAIAAEGVDFALARANARHGQQVLHVELPAEGRAAIELVFVAGADATNGTSYPRVQIHAGRHSNLCLVERHLSAGAAASAINAAVDLHAAAGARVEHHRVQNCADSASCFDTLVAHVGENASYALRSVTLGALTARSTAFIKLAGRGARCEVSAASVANGIQTLDSLVEVDHVAPDTATKEIFRGIATERGKLAFNGKMIVRETAHGADSDQSLKTLLTGSGAEAAARPQLEIYTDKVRAAHGATTGKLDEQMLFYLLSRGIEPATARALLQWAFIEGAVSRIAPAPLRREVEELVAAQLLEVSALNLTSGTLP
jgi:Fe-S cluster assembly protein SufD